MSKSIYLPPPTDRTLDYSHLNFLPAAEKAIKELARSYCPVCNVFVARDELHFSNPSTGQCAKIVNVKVEG